jgi:hypothetical protein
MIDLENLIAVARRAVRRLSREPRQTGGSPPSFPALCDQAVLRCLAAGNLTWIENAFGPASYPHRDQAVNALRHLVVRHLLKEAGDAEGAATILEGLRVFWPAEDANQTFFRLLCRYAARTLEATEPLLPIRRGREGNAISLVVWGDDYIDRFDRYCLASLAAPGNIPALKARGRVTLLIHTTARDAQKIRRLQAIRRLGVGVRIWIIPDELLRLAVGDLKYWMLGAFQSIHLFHAGQRGANVMPVFPDCIYSANFCSNLLDVDGAEPDAVFLSSFKASRKAMTAALERFSAQGVYAVPGPVLLEHALRYVDDHMVRCFIDPRSDTLPAHRMLWGHCGDYLEVRSPHYNAALIRNSAIACIRPRYLMTLDSELDKILPDTSKIHFRSCADEYFATELLDEPTPPLLRLGYEEYASFFVSHANTAHLHFQRSSYKLRIRPEWLTVLQPQSPADVVACFERILRLVEEQMRKAERFDRVDLVLGVLDRLAQTKLTSSEAALVAHAKDAVAGMRHEDGPAA